MGEEKAYRERDMEVGKRQEAKKAELSLPGAPWKGTSFSGTSELHLCAARKGQTDIYGGTSGCFTLGTKSTLGLPTVRPQHSQ